MKPHETSASEWEPLPASPPTEGVFLASELTRWTSLEQAISQAESQLESLAQELDHTRQTLLHTWTLNATQLAATSFHYGMDWLENVHQALETQRQHELKRLRTAGQVALETWFEGLCQSETQRLLQPLEASLPPPSSNANTLSIRYSSNYQELTDAVQRRLSKNGWAITRTTRLETLDGIELDHPLGRLVFSPQRIIEAHLQALETPEDRPNVSLETQHHPSCTSSNEESDTAPSLPPQPRRETRDDSAQERP